MNITQVELDELLSEIDRIVSHPDSLGEWVAFDDKLWTETYNLIDIDGDERYLYINGVKISPEEEGLGFIFKEDRREADISFYIYFYDVNYVPEDDEELDEDADGGSPPDYIRSSWCVFNKRVGHYETYQFLPDDVFETFSDEQKQFYLKNKKYFTIPNRNAGFVEYDS